VANWNGFYLGFNGGWAWSNFDATIAPVGAAALSDFGVVGLGHHADGAVFGGQLGYNWQFSPNWVIGFEGDFDGSGISGTSAVVVPSGLGATDGFIMNERLNWLATIRGRIGYTWGGGMPGVPFMASGMLYFTGGGAWENVKRDVLVSTDTAAGIYGNSATGSFDTTRSGFVIGGGLEWLIMQNWTARAEYLYYDFSNDNNGIAFTFPTCARPGSCGAIAFGSERNINVFRLGANYKF
jgi:outer membrane immunogenic protein